MTRQDPIKVIFDTDIGDDIDDAVALAFALGSPELDVVGVTVAYGDVETRGRVAVNPRAGCLGFVPEEGGPHRWVGEPRAVDGFREEILRRLLSAARRAGR